MKTSRVRKLFRHTARKRTSPRPRSRPTAPGSTGRVLAMLQGAAALKYQRALTASTLLLSQGRSMRGGPEEEELDDARQRLECLLPPLRPSD
ncbi:hypothetical protein [Corallococcus sicarius]|nr:hypothetical protein [Corallococcus sicarius]